MLIGSQKIGIYYKHLAWGYSVFNHIMSKIPPELVAKLVNGNSMKNDRACYLKDGGWIKMIKIGDSARGYKVDKAIVEEGIDRDRLNNLIFPSVIHPIEVISKPEEVTANYATIEQRLPHSRKSKPKLRVVVKC